MITFHSPGQRGVDCVDLGHCHSQIREAVWIDLFEPTEQEEIVVDVAFGVDLPSRQEMQDIELSRRLYKLDDGLFMTATVLTNADRGQPESTSVTFILTDDRLITVRYENPLPFTTFRAEREAELYRFDTGLKILEGLIETIIERIADLLELAGNNLDRVSREIFHAPQPGTKIKGAPVPEAPQRNLEEVLRRLGRNSDLISKIRESVVSLGRLLSFFTAAQKGLPAEMSEHLRTLSHDLQPLSDHASFLSSKVSFLLDATLGLINIEQNAIIKIFTIAAVLFLPPTVVGTIYGMNFETMPELKWAFGYPVALVLMVLSAWAPFHYFKRRGWF